jgi:ribosomal protein L21E
VSAASITTVTSTADNDGVAGYNHVKILQGSTTPVVVNFTYSATKTSVATATVANSPAADVTGSVSGLLAGTNKTGSISLNVSGLSAGTHNLKLVVDDADPGQRLDNDPGAVEVYATVTVTLNVNASNTTYTGSAYNGPVNVHVSPNAAASAGTISLTYYAASDLSTPLAGPPTNAGSYRVVAHFTSSDTSQYTSADGYADFTIAKADAGVTVIGYSGQYNGLSHGARGSVAGVDAGGAALGSSLDLGASFTDVPGGTAHWVFHGGNNYLDEQGDVAIVITKADAVVNVSGYSGQYDASFHGATGSVTGLDAGGTAAGTNLDLGASFKDVPGGTAHWVFSGGTNYNDQSGDVAIIIAKADAVVTVNGYSGKYDALYHGATGSATGVDAGGAALGASLDLGSSFKDVPGGTAHWVFHGGTNYNDQSGDVAIAIAKADAVVKVAGYSGVYDGQYHGATGTVTGVDAGGAALGSSLDLGARFKNVPGGTAYWVFHGGNNYNDQQGQVAVVITPKTLGGNSATTQGSLNIAKEGLVSFRIDVNEAGIVDGKSLADLFNGAAFSLRVNGRTFTVTAQAAFAEGGITVSFRMSDALKAFLASNTTATNASKAPTVAMELSATANGGNYQLNATAYTRLFNTTK